MNPLYTVAAEKIKETAANEGRPMLALYSFRDGGYAQMLELIEQTGLVRGTDIIFHEWKGIDNEAQGLHNCEWSFDHNHDICVEHYSYTTVLVFSVDGPKVGSVLFDECMTLTQNGYDVAYWEEWADGTHVPEAEENYYENWKFVA